MFAFARNATLSRKLLAVLGVVVALMSVPVGLSLWSLLQMGTTVESMVARETEAVKLSVSLHRGLYELRTQEKESALATTDEEKRDVVARVASLRGDLQERLGQLRALGLDVDDLALLAVLEAATLRYDEVLTRVLDHSFSGRGEEASTLSRTAGRQMAGVAAVAAVALTEHQEKRLGAEVEAIPAEIGQDLAATGLLVLFALALGGALVVLTSRNIAGGVVEVVAATRRIADGDLDGSITVGGEDEVGQLAQAVIVMQSSLRTSRQMLKDADWLKTGLGRLNALVLGQADIQKLASNVLIELASTLDAKVGAFFVMGGGEGGPTLSLVASYAYTARKSLSTRFGLGEGLVGQAALEQKQILLQNAPEDYVRVVSGLGDTTPRNLCVTPFLSDAQVRGVVELGTMASLTPLELSYLEQSMRIVGTAFAIAHGQAQTKQAQLELLANVEELNAQQQKLQNANAELEVQMRRVKDSDERARVQAEELEVKNVELRETNTRLERQRLEMESARAALVVQTEDLAMASKYKSDFLANMSHELRTPLNSLLLLARSLRDNREGNLSAGQVESAQVIFDSGGDLLNLINEILDLSKIEAGRMEVRPQVVELTDVCRLLHAQFDHMAQNQGLALVVKVAPGAPQSLVTDSQRLAQVLKNLIGNALKFTERGTVTVTFAEPASSTKFRRSGLTPAQTLAIHVKDTGIGIPLDKQKIVFEAFQQADSGDRRRFGGTGLGLSISREIAALLGGEIHLVSEPDRGSTFTLYLPRGLAGPALGEPRPRPKTGSLPGPVPSAASSSGASISPPAAGPFVPDDRAMVGPGDRVILVIEDDVRFAEILATCIRERGFKCLVATTGEDGVALAREFLPMGVVLDLLLPNMSGWQVLSILKEDIQTRHIPVHIVSSEDQSKDTLRIGAIGHASKPVSPADIQTVLEKLQAANALEPKKVLVVEDDDLMRRETLGLIGNGNVVVVEARSAFEALDAMREHTFALIVLDLGLPDMPGLELLEQIAANFATLPPVIVYTVSELTPEEEASLRRYADSIILKDVRSQERLIDEVALFLHRVVGDLPDEKRKAILRLHATDEPLRGRRVLLVEDDMRTMFAMARLLAEHGIEPIKAENGERALSILRLDPSIDLILMDMMMPVLDGYETCRQIKDDVSLSKPPIIALTAKAMREDRQLCIDAGAADYMSKPVDPERLLSLMRVWLSR